MSRTLKSPSATDVLRSLRLLRSSDPAERKRAISILGVLRDDPRVRQVLEYLYQKDTDSEVRRMAWYALNQHDPSVPAPGPEPVAQNRTKANKALPRSNRMSSARALFLINPANARFVAKETRKFARRKRGGRTALMLAGLLLLVVGVLWGLVLPDLVTWYRLRQDGITVEGWVDELQTHEGRFYVLFGFYENLEDEQPTAGKQRVSREAFDGLSPEETIAVTYYSGDPTVFRLDEDNPDDARRDRLAIAASGLTVVLLLVLLLAAIQHRPGSVRRGRHLLKGELVSCAGHLDDDEDFNLKLRYRFRSPTGKTIVSQISQIRNDLKHSPLPEAGAPVAVYYKNDRSFLLL